MVTRSQIKLATIRLNQQRDAANNPSAWYLRREAFEMFIHVANAAVAALRLTDKSVIATAIESIIAVIPTAPKDTTSKDALHAKMSELKNRLRYTSNVNSAEYQRIDAQIDLLIELLNKQEKNV